MRCLEFFSALARLTPAGDVSRLPVDVAQHLCDCTNRAILEVFDSPALAYSKQRQFSGFLAAPETIESGEINISENATTFTGGIDNGDVGKSILIDGDPHLNRIKSYNALSTNSLFSPWLASTSSPSAILYSDAIDLDFSSDMANRIDRLIGPITLRDTTGTKKSVIAADAVAANEIPTWWSEPEPPGEPSVYWIGHEGQSDAYSVASRIYLSPAPTRVYAYEFRAEVSPRPLWIDDIQDSNAIPMTDRFVRQFVVPIAEANVAQGVYLREGLKPDRFQQAAAEARAQLRRQQPLRAPTVSIVTTRPGF